jgi:hypothetical protein
MSRARHHMEKECRAKGGAVGGREGMWVAGNPDVKKEAEGEEPYAEGDERKHGGKVKKHKGKKHGMHAEGHKAPHRMDRPKRARGGKVGSDRNPFSSAHHSAKGYDPKVSDDRGMKVSSEKDTRDNHRGNQNS